MGLFSYFIKKSYIAENTALRSAYVPNGNVSPVCSCNQKGTGFNVGNLTNNVTQRPVLFQNVYREPHYLLYGGVPFNGSVNLNAAYPTGD